MSLRAENRFGRYLRVRTDRGLLEDWFVRPPADVVYIQNCVNTAATYGQAYTILSRVARREPYFRQGLDASLA